MVLGLQMGTLNQAKVNVSINTVALERARLYLIIFKLCRSGIELRRKDYSYCLLLLPVANHFIWLIFFLVVLPLLPQCPYRIAAIWRQAALPGLLVRCPSPHAKGACYCLAYSEAAG